ncbi:hypothetical protein AB1484_18740 [Parafrankia sp. FMc6]|uniref:hypothetical protein n=1 Tax=Parafrankia soli TaxID=2599596 RepID=UPI0034D62AF1
MWEVADPARPQRRSTADGATAGIRSVAFSPRGGLLAFAGNDGTVRLTDVSAAAHPVALIDLRGHMRAR